MSECSILKCKKPRAYHTRFCAIHVSESDLCQAIAELEQLLRKVVEDSEIGVVPRSHLNAIEAALGDK